MKLGWGGKIVLGALVTWGTLGAAKEIPWFKTHQVRKGESLTGIAKHYYGEVWKYVYIRAANRLTDESKVEPGVQLRIPDVIEHQVRAGDSYAKLSQLYFGNKEFFELIIWANDKKTMEAPVPGTIVRIPHVLKHAVQTNDKLEGLAQLYYHDKAMAPLLKQWNHLKKNSLVGVTTVWLPIRDGIIDTPAPPSTPAPTPSPTAEPTTTPEPTPTPPAVTMVHKPKESISIRPADEIARNVVTPDSFDATSMALVKEQMRAGRYGEALSLMRKIALDSFKTPSQKGDFYWQVFQCHVAMGRQPEALKALQRYLEVGEEDLAALKAQLPQLSPKIRAVVEIYEQKGLASAKTSQTETK